LSQDFELDDFNMINMKAKHVLEALHEFEKEELVRGELIHKRTGLAPIEINEAIKALAKSLLVDIPDSLKNSKPYHFYAVEITDFGRQVLEKYGNILFSSSIGGFGYSICRTLRFAIAAKPL